jgi:hypothetical protein
LVQDWYFSEAALISSTLKAFEFCLPRVGTTVPAGHDWLHEIKYDGYRLRVERNGDRVRLITRGGYDWTKPKEYLKPLTSNQNARCFNRQGPYGFVPYLPPCGCRSLRE